MYQVGNMYTSFKSVSSRKYHVFRSRPFAIDILYFLQGTLVYSCYSPARGSIPSSHRKCLQGVAQHTTTQYAYYYGTVHYTTVQNTTVHYPILQSAYKYGTVQYTTVY